MSSTTSRRAAAVATVAVLGAAAGAGLSGFAAADTPVAPGQHHTSLSIRVARHHVAPGSTDRIGGDLRVAKGQSPAGHTVTLTARAEGETTFSPIGDAATRTHGGVSFSVTPTVTTRYRLVFAGDPANKPSHSGVVRVAVGPRTHSHPGTHRLNTTLTIRRLHHGGLHAATVIGRLRSFHHGLRNQLVSLLANPKGTAGWTFVAAHRTRRAGAVQFRVRPLVDTRYRLRYAGTPNFQPSRSGVVGVKARPAQEPLSCTLSISERTLPKHEVIRGVLTGAGHGGLPGRKVELQQQAPNSTTWTDVAGKRTRANGHVAFHRPLDTTPTSYRLSFAGGSRFAGCVSGVVGAP